jgi:acetylglutamate/LysW-gamma-L-alpha-aminoadipate kinase
MTLVIKIGGAAGISADGLLDDLAALAGGGDRIVLVHGGSDETSRLQEALGRPAEFLTSPSGHVSRRTDRPALETFAMATALINRRLVEGLAARGIRGFGLSGLDGRLVTAERKGSVRAVVDGRVVVLRDEWTGRPARVDAGLLTMLLERGLMPVLAPLAISEAGEMLNVDGDRLAGAVAAALGSETLVILSNVPGLLENVEDPGSVVAHVPGAELERAEGLARGRMRKKVLGAREALEGGVRRVVIGDARHGTPVTDALGGAGTVLGTALHASAGGRS